MALHQFQVRLYGTSGLPEDVFENVLWYEVNAPDTVQGTCNELRDLYVGSGAGQAVMIGGYNKVEVRAYAASGGQPVASAGPTSLTARSPGQPNEMAVCLSYAASDDPQASSARRRGRIYIGPIVGGNTNGRPSPTVLTQVLAFGQSLAAVGTAGNTTWKLYSRTDGVSAKIESIWVDDAWDVQRRRGLKPSSRQVQDVQ